MLVDETKVLLEFSEKHAAADFLWKQTERPPSLLVPSLA